ncbi:palmitoyltransferase ZDHHC15 isoform X2 [Passer domesticus]|uniref:palmitoyltransferase ZDHHC15 isoform X2 n=1 Tax=Passer domesticus TaxID=48849 RepID=UPI0030FE41BC
MAVREIQDSLGQPRRRGGMSKTAWLQICLPETLLSLRRTSSSGTGWGWMWIGIVWTPAPPNGASARSLWFWSSATAILAAVSLGLQPLGMTFPGAQSATVTVSNPVEKVAYLVVFHILFVLFVWTYWKSVFTLPIPPGKKFHMSYADQERYESEERPEVQRQILAEIARKLPVYTRTGNGGIRFCDRCQLIKPDRCHHCSVCAMCVLKMDHHCPWVNNCIGFSNYKFFLLFLAYSLLYCLYIAATVFKYFIKYWTGELTNGRSKFHILFLLFVAIMFFVSLMFLFGYHCWLVSRNRSTLEAFSAPVFQNGPDKNGFNLGFVKNLQQVFGEEKKLWLLPIASSQGDGHFFPMRTLSEARNPLLTNEEQWEEDGIDEEPQGSGEASSLAIERET